MFCSKKKDLLSLSELGHFLKGSSAALGVAKVQATCTSIQNYGKRSDDRSPTMLSESEALNRIKPLLKRVREEFEEASDWLIKYYEKQGISGPAE